MTAPLTVIIDQVEGRFPMSSVQVSSDNIHRAEHARAVGRSQRREVRAAHAFLAPALVFFAIFLLLPFVFAIVLSMSKWGGFDITRIQFVGFTNFKNLFGPTSLFINPILWQTLLFSVMSVALTVIGALIITSCIERLRFQGFWRLLFFLPVVTNVAAIGNVWKQMYQPYGLINGMLNTLGIKSIKFLNDTSLALPSVAVVYAWVSIGTATLILTAGIKSIDAGIYEAAELDGANSWKVFWNITLPLLRPTLLFVTITQVISSMQSFVLMISMTQGGGPANSTKVAALAMYQTAFNEGNYGSANAMAIILFAIIFIATLIQLWVNNRRGEED